jgi:hypothetical protein
MRIDWKSPLKSLLLRLWFLEPCFQRFNHFSDRFDAGGWLDPCRLRFADGLGEFRFWADHGCSTAPSVLINDEGLLIRKQARQRRARRRSDPGWLQFVDAVFDERGRQILSRQTDGVRRRGGAIFAKQPVSMCPYCTPAFLGYTAAETVA